MLPTFRLPCKVISIGNITVGGTGKTPMVYCVACFLIKQGYKVAILTRGYRGRASRNSTVVSDGSKIFTGPQEAGDEAIMLSKKLPEVPILAGRDRASTGAKAIKDFGVEIVIIDDGFHYHRLARDLDIVLINYRNPFGNSFMLPRGILREPLAGLKRSHITMVTKMDEAGNASHLEKRIKHYSPHALIFKSTFQAKTVRMVYNNEVLSFDSLKGKQVVGFCSIADPDYFFSILKFQAINVIKTISFPDHHWYGKKDYTMLSHCANKADFLITTEKDIAKMDLRMIEEKKLLVLEIDLVIVNEKKFFQAINTVAAIPFPNPATN